MQILSESVAVKCVKPSSYPFRAATKGNRPLEQSEKAEDGRIEPEYLYGSALILSAARLAARGKNVIRRNVK